MQGKGHGAAVSGLASDAITPSSASDIVSDYGRIDLGWSLPCDVDVPGTSSSDSDWIWVCCKLVEIWRKELLYSVRVLNSKVG